MISSDPPYQIKELPLTINLKKWSFILSLIISSPMVGPWMASVQSNNDCNLMTSYQSDQSEAMVTLYQNCVFEKYEHMSIILLGIGFPVF